MEAAVSRSSVAFHAQGITPELGRDMTMPLHLVATRPRGSRIGPLGCWLPPPGRALHAGLWAYRLRRGLAPGVNESVGIVSIARG